MYHYGMNNILGSLRGQTSPAERRGITLGGDFSRNATLASYNRPAQSNTFRSFEGDMKTKVEGNLDNVVSLIEAHPDTEFVFFFPPFSILYWDRELRSGTFDATMDATEYAISVLLSYDNVRLYFYQAEEEIISDLDHYKDYSHYGNWINNMITEWIAEDYGRVTPDNYQEIILDMRNMVHNYDYDSIF